MPGSDTETVGMPSLAASSRRSFLVCPMADSARLSFILRLLTTFLPGGVAVPRAEAIMLMGCRLSMATSSGRCSVRILLIWCRIVWSRCAE